MWISKMAINSRQYILFSIDTKSVSSANTIDDKSFPTSCRTVGYGKKYNSCVPIEYRHSSMYRHSLGNGGLKFTVNGKNVISVP